jgi:hypothetical protein
VCVCFRERRGRRRRSWVWDLGVYVSRGDETGEDCGEGGSHEWETGSKDEAMIAV